MVTCMHCHLSTQVEVAQEDGGLRAGDDQDDEDQEEKSKHIVHLMRPATSMIYIGLQTCFFCLGLLVLWSVIHKAI